MSTPISPAARPDAVATPSKPMRDHGPLMGFLYVVLFFVGLIGSSVVGGAVYPSPFDDASKIQQYFADNHDAVILMGIAQTAAALALVVFAAGIGALVRDRTNLGSGPGGVVQAAGTLSAAFLMLSGLSGWITVRDEALAQPALVRALHDFAFMTGGVAQVTTFGLFVGTASAAALKAGLLPRWICWLGGVCAAASLASVLALASEPAAFLLPVGRFSGIIWVVAAGVVLTLRRPVSGRTQR
ncbi:DUF4386 family protein [Actinomadura barringtoniae]|uniref:DUF4386 family protein n=1 Tax=Actinomadura barringtoniae TaxID=1427535 RepID=A0A939P7U0_9ACTN|nr:DUF4386 family protein [Actinomadura barringtoniae]MBO2447386.1 DUF4386 family protein [Actinomadura barringtoniae]